MLLTFIDDVNIVIVEAKILNVTKILLSNECIDKAPLEVYSPKICKEIIKIRDLHNSKKCEI